MEFHCQLHKMIARNESPVKYLLKKDEAELCLNDYIGKQISFRFLNEIICTSCGRKTSKSFFQGFCFPCFKNSPEAAECIVNPELCRAHLGEGRDVEWEEKNHNTPHSVYLSNTTGIKVGVTRNTQIPSRWIDQGATEALVLAETPNRYLAGCIEVALKSHIADKTAWQRMLKFEHIPYDLSLRKSELVAHLPEELRQYVIEDEAVTQIKFPVTQYPEKVKSISLDKEPYFCNTLMGIKGQYLIFDTGQVFNVRKHSGYSVVIKD